MLYAESLTKAYGGDGVLRDVEFTIGDGQRVGLVGPNGAGKSTLLRLIAGEEMPDAGIAGHRGGDFGFHHQDAGLESSRPLIEELWTAFPEARAVEAELAQVAERIERSGDDLDVLIARQSELFERYEALDGYRIDRRISRVLDGLGFAPEDRDRACGEFSGGWQMRVALAKVLVHRPANLLLDEPTNHLDTAARDWLALELADYRGTILLVTHDGEFLDVVVERVLELRDRTLESYEGNYSDYQRQKAERLHAQDQAASRQERELKRQQRFIDRFRSKATKATQVRSRERQLARVERIERSSDEQSVRFRLASSGRIEREVLHVEGVTYSYDDDPVLIGVSLAIERGQRAVLVGPNGGGKSTLLRCLAGQLEPSEGRIEWASRAELGYYDQHQDEALTPSRSVLEEVRSVAGDQSDGALRDVLGRFLFRGDDVFKSIAVLSGGERSRVALAKFLIQPSNVLLLDEPTNHLDLSTRRALVEALEGYDGTILCASHDPWILDRVATRVFHVEDGDCVEREELRTDWA
jgi:ATP-binding cassette subfamily F protein 3